MPKGMIRPIWNRRSLASLCRSFVSNHWTIRQFYQADVLTQGKPVLLNVWATWCPTCRAEHQYLNQLSAQGIRVVGMNYKDDRQKAISWLKELGNPYALSLFDGDGMLGLDLGVYGAPETFLIDGNGIIRYRHAGDLNPRVWEEEIAAVGEIQ